MNIFMKAVEDVRNGCDAEDTVIELSRTYEDMGHLLQGALEYFGGSGDADNEACELLTRYVERAAKEW
jgi:hypothetical protein